VAQPFLDLGDVGLVRERVGGSRGAQGVHAETVHLGTDACLQAVFLDNVAVRRMSTKRRIALPLFQAKKKYREFALDICPLT